MNAVHGLYAIIDPRFLPVAHSCVSTSGDVCLDYVRDLCAGGCRVIQLRVKDIDDADDLRWRYAAALASLRSEYDFTFIVNDDVACAREFGAQGVHLGENDMPLPEAREILGRDAILGYSAHSVAEAKAAEASGADYVAFGAIFSSATKGPGYPVQGLEKLSQVVNTVAVPVVAIGGIHRNNVDLVRETGAQSIAMITGLSRAEDPRGEAAWYTARLAQ